MKKIAVLVGLAVFAVAVAWAHNVPTGETLADRHYGRMVMIDQGKETTRREPGHRSFAEQIAIIRDVQAAVLAHAPGGEGIAKDYSREPRDFYAADTAACYDRSRTIEKLLAGFGYETRHVAIYSTAETGSALKSLLMPGTPSHSVTEVKTSRGWLVVGSNSRWVSLDLTRYPLSMAKLQWNAERRINWWGSTWSMRNVARPPDIFTEPFTYVIGLYSRHGRFYPPYTPFPDVNWRDFAANFVGA